MRALIQRVSEASVSVEGQCIAAIGRGLLVLLGVERGDGPPQAARMVDKLLAYRVFADGEGRMNRSVLDVRGGVLLVSQFTLAADTGRGLRPGFSRAAAPQEARQLYELMCQLLAGRCPGFGSGCFGADMQVGLVNDGPVTFMLEIAPGPAG
jgi:D-tyrosyl-tRNA(Tyr) deacylase